MEKSPWFHGNNWKHQCYQHSSHTRSKTQQLLGRKLTLSQLKPGHYLCHILHHLLHAQLPHFSTNYDYISCLLMYTHLYNSLSLGSRTAWQGFGSSGAAGVASMKSCKKPPLCSTEPMPASSKMDLPLAKAEPISDSDSTSVITYLRRGKKKKQNDSCSRREESEYVRETTLQTPMSMKKEGEECQNWVFPCSPWWRPWWGRLSPCSPWRLTLEQISTCSPWRTAITGGCTPRRLWPSGESVLEQGPSRISGSVERGAHAGAGLLAGLVTVKGTQAGVVCSWRTAARWEDSHYKGLSPTGGTTRWNKGRAWSGRNIWQTDRNSFPHLLALLRGK